MKKVSQSSKVKSESKLKAKKALKGGKILNEKIPGGRGRHGGPFQI